MALNHIGVIMDGNGRWAQEQGKARTFGHRNAVNAIRDVIQESQNQNIACLTLFCFSSQNWNRPKKEVSFLMNAFSRFMKKYIKKLAKYNIKFRVIGERWRFEPKLLTQIEELEQVCNQGSLTVNLAISYGGKEDILAAVNQIVKDVKADKIKEQIDEELFASYLQTAPCPPLDLLIRTGGEKRISNFLLYQAAYAELYFIDKYWPAFTKEDFKAALDYYYSRNRRFGGLNEN